MESESRYIIGIDLGTTNSAVSYVDLQESPEQKRIGLFKIPQLTGPGEVTGLPILPSFCYIPGKFDISSEMIQLPWESGEEGFVGKFARDQGVKVPVRLVSSAKSWLCHSGADRRARILPWGAGAEVSKISPVQATAAYLRHIRLAWNSLRGGEDELYLENQRIIITVPASFDEVARDLTLEAASMAGLREVTLLEEPLAAFYSWLSRHEKDWLRFIHPGELVLVCDVGGGTSDFTLITLRESEGSPRFERIAVGDHLILGGDNIDLALARQMEQRFKMPSQLTADRWKTLCHLCRQAKENMLDQNTEFEQITLIGEGSRLIGGTLSARLDRETLEHILLEGFFPLVACDTASGLLTRKGISEFGLPYEPDPAITRHIGRFLEKHREDVQTHLNKEPFPDLILFNGGSLKPRGVQDRIREAIRFWFSKPDRDRPRMLDNPHPELAVALGASYYGLVKAGRGVRVGSGSARAYYLGVSRKEKEENAPKTAICLVERGLDEGSRIVLPDREFEVVANQPVVFDLYSSSFRSGDRCGDLIDVDESLTPLLPLQTVIQFGQKGRQTTIPVRIEAEFSETGVLALWCSSLSTPHRWRLGFQLRGADAVKTVADREVFESSLVDAAAALVREAFSVDSALEFLPRLMKSIAATVSRPREKWPLGFIRRLADELLDILEARRLSAAHEIRWLNLTGYCLRPGFGEGMDDQRIRALWKIYRQGVCFRKNPQALSEWWILWRRVAGGLSAGQQRQFIQDMRSVLLPQKKSGSRIQGQQLMEAWMAVANMERLSVKDKIELGNALLLKIRPPEASPQMLWSISRIGARELLYGPVDRVVPPKAVWEWIEPLMREKWNNPEPVGTAIAQMARKTGDRSRDLPLERIQSIMEWMGSQGLSHETRFLTSVIPIAHQEENRIFGEGLPSGIRLRDPL